MTKTDREKKIDELTDLLDKRGYLTKEERKLYLDAAFAICDFAVRVQKESGAFAKCWHEDGSVAIEEGSVGAFLALPLVEGYR